MISDYNNVLWTLFPENRYISNWFETHEDLALTYGINGGRRYTHNLIAISLKAVPEIKSKGRRHYHNNPKIGTQKGENILTVFSEICFHMKNSSKYFFF